MPIKYVKQLEDMISHFIWNGTPKIAMKIIKGSKFDGGLGLVNIPKKELALKFQWVSKAINDDLIRELASRLLKNPMGELLWKVNLDYKDAMEHIPNTNFWSSWFAEWCNFKFIKPQGKVEIENQVLWWNSNVRIANKPVLYKECLKKGVMRVSDVFDTNGVIISYESFVQKYGVKIDYLKYMGLANAIPKYWKKMMKENVSEFYRDPLANWTEG